MSCKHCGLPIPAGVEDEFCCGGCRAVYGLLHDEGLERYYALRTGPGMAVQEAHGDRAWLEEVDGSRIELDVQGIHCAGCVWLIEELFDRQGGQHVDLNPTLGRMTMHVPEGFSLGDFVEQVESFGYRLGPAGALEEPSSDGLLIRTGICVALAGNAMFYVLALYFGLDDGPIFRLLGQMSFAAAVLSVLVGGTVFFKSAWQGLRRGILHLDLPIAIGIALAFVGSTWSYFFGGGHAVYVDTLTIFIALMLLGRWLQERMLERNRRRLLGDEGPARLRTRVVKDGRVALVPCSTLEEGDELFVGSGDLVPVDAELLDDEGAFGLDWIDGESAPRRFAKGERVPAGAFQVGRAPRRLRTLGTFEDSAVHRLLRAQRERDGSGAWWRRVSVAYVVGVLFAATVAFVTWTLLAGAPRAIEVATAVLVVTCPCAFGIAAPLAYELALARLRRRGLHVMRRGFLDRVRTVSRIVFDKTGTLTTGALRLEDPAALDTLEAPERRALHVLATATTHPKSAAVAHALRHAGLPPALPVEEVPGSGVSLGLDGHLYQLGAARWLGEGDADLVFAVDGVLRLELPTEEHLRPDAAAQVAALASRYDLAILSGDRQERVDEVAAALHIEDAFGDRSPDDKAAYLAAHDPERTLMIGDGLNDVLAAVEAGCSGTAAIDRPFLASRCDFYFTSPGIAPIADALRVADQLGRTLKVILGFAVVYNVVAVAIAMAGYMQPWLAAVLMPTSSLVTVSWVLWRMAPRQAKDGVPEGRGSRRTLGSDNFDRAPGERPTPA